MKRFELFKIAVIPLIADSISQVPMEDVGYLAGLFTMFVVLNSFFVLLK